EAPIGETEAASVPIVDETIMEEAAAAADEADADSVIANAPTAVLESPDVAAGALNVTTPTAPLIETAAEAQTAPPPAELAAAPASVESQAVPTGAAEHQARLELARALREVDLHESAGQYKSLADDGVLLAEVITDLHGWLQSQPNERVVRVLLAEALTKAG